MGNRKPNIANLLAFLPPQEQFSPDMLLDPNAQVQAPPQAQQPLTMVNQINRSQTSSNASPQLGYGQQFDQAFYKQMQDRAMQDQALQKQMQELQSQKPNAFKEADLSTLLAYGDQLSGSRLAQNYKAPTAAQERKAMIEKLRGEVTKSQQGIADDQLAYLKMKAQEEKDRMSEQRMMARLNAGDPKGEERLRKEFNSNKQVTAFGDIMSAGKAIENNPAITGPDQQALITQFAKILDPGSVVRETEFAIAARNSGQLAKIENLFEKFRTGKDLTPEAVANMKAAVKPLLKGYEDSFNKTKGRYSDLAKRYGYSPENVVFNPYEASGGNKRLEDMSVEELDQYIKQNEATR
jgi:hypothetical protein